MLRIIGLTECLCYDNLLKVINNRIIIEYLADRVRVALNREAGERPALSRSCNVESTSIRHWETGKARKTRKQSQKNCPIGTLYRPCERQEGTIIFMCFVCLFAGEQEGFLFCAFSAVNVSRLALSLRPDKVMGNMDGEIPCD